MQTLFWCWALSVPFVLFFTLALFAAQGDEL